MEADVVVAQSLPLGLIRGLHRAGIRIVFDLYAPALVEAAAILAGEDSADRSGGIRYEEVVAVTRVALQLGDAFLCASDRQRDHWLGALAALGRVSPEVYGRDPALRSLVAVVPFGLDPAPPGSGPVVKGVLPGIGADDRLLLWGGGVWNWFDPLTVIRAVGRLSDSRSDVKLLFLGLKHPSSAVAEMTMADRAVALAVELGLDGSSVFFNRDWVPYDERLAWFCRGGPRRECASRLVRGAARVPHQAARPHRRRNAPGRDARRRPRRPRRVEGHGPGPAPGDVDGWTDALADLLDDDRAYAAARTAVKAAQDELSWSRVGEPLADLIERVASAPSTTLLRTCRLLRAAATLARSSLDRRGLRATLAAASRAISGGARR